MRDLIPIDTIESEDEPLDGEPFVPQALSYDPDANDGSASREGVKVSKWRLRTLSGDRLESVSEPSGRDWRSRKARRMHDASRRARSQHKRASRGIARVIVALLVTVAVAGAVYAGVTYALEIWGGRTVPSVKGWVQATAVDELKSRGFEVSTKEVYSDSAEGRVVSMEPESGTRLEPGSTVTLSVGVYRTIPEVVGMTEAQARKVLTEAGVEHVRLRSEFMLEDEDRVLEVIPAAGSRFMSSDEITLVVTQLPLVPDVVGNDEAVARARIEYDGIPVRSQYERSTVENRLLVVRTEPEADMRAGDDGVTLFVGDPLVQITRLTDYFDCSTSHTAAFVVGEGYEPKVGHLTQDGNLVASYLHADGSRISFVSDPWSRAIDNDTTPYTEVMDDSHPIKGVRFSTAVQPGDQGTAAQPGDQGTTAQPGDQGTDIYRSFLGIDGLTVDEGSALNIMNLCGFEGIKGSCTQAAIASPAGSNTAGHVFYCCYGEKGSHIWTVLLRGSAAVDNRILTQVVITCAPKSTYATIDLSAYGNQICNYVAYQDEFLG